MEQIPFIKTLLSPMPVLTDAEKSLFAGKFRVADENRLEQSLCYLTELAASNRVEALCFFERLAATIEQEERFLDVVAVASVYQIGAWLHAGKADHDAAIACVVKSLLHLAVAKDKASAEVKSILANLMYVYATACLAANSCSKAEKAICRASRIYNELVSSGKLQFLEASAIVAKSSLKACRSSVKRLDAIDRHSMATASLFADADEGSRNALARLVDAVVAEADEMLAIGRYRIALRYLTKAIRYQRQLSGKPGLKDLQLAIRLAGALLYVPLRRDTGMKLVLATKRAAEAMNAQHELAEIIRLEKQGPRIRAGLVSFIKNVV